MIGQYVHAPIADGLGKIAVIVALESTGDKAVLAPLARQIAMHVAAASPIALDAASIDPAVIAREKAVLADKNAGKPAHVLEKIVDSGLKTYFKEVTLVDQVSIHADHAGKIDRPGRQGSRRQGRRADPAQGLRALRARRGHREAGRRFRRRSRRRRQGLIAPTLRTIRNAVRESGRRFRLAIVRIDRAADTT